MNYPWKNLSPKDRLILMKSTILSDVNSSTVITLYQPLIGSTATSLYLLMKEYVAHADSVEIPLSDLLVQLSAGMKVYYEARIKLEAYGLLKVYRHEEENSQHILCIEAPMHPISFFSDPMLKMLLTEKLGLRIVEELESRHTGKKAITSEYREVTKSFLDVVHVNMEKFSQSTGTGEVHKPDQSLTIAGQVLKSSDFDWHFFIEGLNKHYIKTHSLTKDIKELIETFHTIYGINELDMQRFVLEAAEIDTGEVSEKKLTHIIHDYYLHSTPSQPDSKEEPDDSSYREKQLKQKGYSNEEIEIILHAETMQPFAYLKSIKQQKGGFISSNETWLLKELVEQAPLPVSVINILINYLLIVKNAPTLEKNLANKIANDWAQSHVKSPEDAMQKVKELYTSFNEKNSKKKVKSSSRSSYNKSSNRQETLPSWANEKSQKTDERVSKEEEEAFREKLRKIRNRKSGEN